eukprot:9413476-Pyramimonas_sp.AAC.1
MSTRASPSSSPPSPTQPVLPTACCMNESHRASGRRAEAEHPPSDAMPQPPTRLRNTRGLEAARGPALEGPREN